MVDNGNGTIDQVGTVADNDDACRLADGLVRFVKQVVLGHVL